MKRSRATFASEAGRYVHLAVFGVLALLSVNHPVALFFLGAEGIYLWKHARRILAGALFVALVLIARMAMIATAAPFAATSFSGVVTATEADRFTVRTDGKKVYVYHDGGVLAVPGDVVAVTGSAFAYEPRSVAHGFDYGRFLLAEGIAGTIRADRVDIVGKRFVPGVIAFALARFADARFDGPARAMVGLFVLGDAEALPAELGTASVDLGISHLFAVSGMHVGAIALFLESLLRRLHLRRGIQAAIGIAVLLLFTAVTGFAVSIVRAVAIYAAALLNKLLRLPFAGTDLMAFVTVAVLAANPFSLFTAGFQLSYLVSFAIVLGGELLKDFDPVRKTLFVGLIANAAALPVLLELNGAFNVAGIPANLVFVLFVDRFAVPLAFFTFFVPAAEPLLDGVGAAFFAAIGAAGSIDLSIAVNFASDLAKAAYWLIAGCAFVRLSTGRKIVWQGALAALLACLCALFPEVPGVTRVEILDVGQGDAIYISAPACRMLIDTGKSDEYDTVVERFLKGNVHALDYVVLTHGDADHDGEIADLAAHLRIGTIVAGGASCPGCAARTTIVRTGDSFTCGKIEFDVLSAGDPADNAGSVVLYAVIGTDEWLFAGDLPTAIEARIDFPDVDVLKVGHHGSATSTSDRLLSATTPAFAVISVGRTNGYGHPDAAVLARLETAGAAVLRTDRFGTITFLYPPWGGRMILKHAEDDRFENAANRILPSGLLYISERRRDIMDSVIE